MEHTEYLVETRCDGKPRQVVRKTYRNLDLVKLIVRNTSRYKDIKINVYELKIEKLKMRRKELIVEENDNE